MFSCGIFGKRWGSVPQTRVRLARVLDRVPPHAGSFILHAKAGAVRTFLDNYEVSVDKSAACR